MKKIKYASLFIATSFIGVMNTFAATSSISAPKQVEVGHSVKATVTLNAAAWDIKVNGTGNTNGCSTHDANASDSGKNIKKSISVSCTANSTGVIRVTYKGDITDANGSTKDVSGSAVINVVAARPKSTNNNLKSLTIEGLELSPEFNKDTLEYSSTAEPGTEKINIKAEKADGYASITGDGEKDVVEGENKFEITVTSETGVAKTYVVNVTVKEFAPIIININNDEYSIVRKIGDLTKPNGYVDKTININDNQIEALYNESLNKTLLYLKNSDGKAYLFEYNDGEYTRYYEFTFKSFTLNILKMKTSLLPNGYKKYSISFLDDEIVTYKKSKDSDYGLVYAVDTTTGKEDLYQIDFKNETAQVFNKELISSINSDNKKILIVIGSLLGVIFIEFIALLISKNKRKRIMNKIKAEKVEKAKNKAIDDAKKETIKENKEEKEDKKKKS